MSHDVGVFERSGAFCISELGRARYRGWPALLVMRALLLLHASCAHTL